MSKILDSIVVKDKLPKILETANNFIINGQSYDKDTLEPIKFNNIYNTSTSNDITMNVYARVDKDNNSNYYSNNCVLVDKYDPDYSYIIYGERDGWFRTIKFINRGTKLEILKEVQYNYSFLYCEIFSQDVNYIYGYYTDTSYRSNIFKIEKSTLTISSTSIVSTYNSLKLLKDTPLFIYYCYSTGADNFYIGKYNKSGNSKTDIYNDNGTTSTTFYSAFNSMLINENEVLTLRTSKSFNDLSKDKLILRKYIIDYDYEKIYFKNIELDCTLVPDEYVERVNSNTCFTDCNYFKVNEKEYFTFWNKSNKNLYLAKKTSENVYSITQIYEFANNYYGDIPYNNNQTLILYNSSSVDFLSFRQLEEKFELSTSLKGNFLSLGIDKSECIWVQNLDNSVDIIGLNVPTIAEALFLDQDLEYKNNDIETFIEVFCKNFNGDLLETNVEVFLSGPIKFSDTLSKRKSIKTSPYNTVRIPVTITNSGVVETNIKII